jgi:hypothetical protein
MAPEEVELELTGVRIRDRNMGELAEPGLDPIRESRAPDDFLQSLPTRIDAFGGRWSESDRLGSPRDAHDVVEAKPMAVD